MINWNKDIVVHFIHKSEKRERYREKKIQIYSEIQRQSQTEIE